MDNKFEYKSLVREALLKWHEASLEQYQAWILETVKTLAIVNSAGLAGVAAIYASESSMRTLISGYPSGALFAIGLGAAVVDMYANALGHLRRQNEVFSRIQQLDEGNLDPQDALSPENASRFRFLAASVAGWTSAVTFLAGAWPFIRPALSLVLP